MTDLSGIAIHWQIHCIDFARAIPGMGILARHDLEEYFNPKQMVDFFNRQPGTKDYQRLRSSADIVVIIRKSLTNWGGTGHKGVRSYKSAILMKSDFLFGRYNLAQAVGYMIGAGHEEEKETDPSIFWAYSYIMENNYCGVMASPKDRRCIPGPFFSNPSKVYPNGTDGKKTGRAYANNALWIHHNRYQLARIGTEKMKCRSDYMYHPKLLDCFLNRRFKNCDYAVPDHVVWG